MAMTQRRPILTIAGIRPAPTKDERARADLELLAQRWPAFAPTKVGRGVRYGPLARGIHREIAEALGWPQDRVRRALRLHAGRSGYLGALEAGAARYALDGELCGEGTPEEV